MKNTIDYSKEMTFKHTRRLITNEKKMHKIYDVVRSKEGASPMLSPTKGQQRYLPEYLDKPLVRQR